jgi:hypothetical protein
MLSIIEKFMRQTPPETAPTAEATELLATSSLPDPSSLYQQLSAFVAHRDTDEARCEQIQHDGRAFLELQAIAERRPRLQAQIDALTSQITTAEKRRTAFVALVEILDATDQQIAQALQRLYPEVLTAPKDQRRANLEAIDGLVRLRARIAAPLAVVAPARRFRRAPDPFAALADDLRARADEIDRYHAPGMPHAAIPWPPGALELIAELNGRQRP